MTTPKKNPAAVALGRRGGKAKSQAKTEAARRNIRLRWARAKGYHCDKCLAATGDLEPVGVQLLCIKCRG